uniref:Uncharacterized protein n=1 Tax=Tanacetum cinerariifolium TaxID=118510 RepID=A0A699IGX4_TANCI|nr:hypothetical protein [Tanacetum cinerariifolium]
MSMSSLPAPSDTETILFAGEVRGSSVPTPFSDDPYMLPLSLTPAPPSPDYTPATPYTDEESEPLETSKTRITSSPPTTPPADLTTLPSSQQPPLTQTSPTPALPRSFLYRTIAWMAVRTQPTLSLGISNRLTEAMTLSPSSFRKRYRSSYEIRSSSSPTLPSRKRYRGTSELITDTETESDKSEDEGTNSESEEAALEDQQQQAVQAKDTAEDDPLGLGYRTVGRYALELAEGTVPITYEVGQSSKSTQIIR